MHNLCLFAFCIVSAITSSFAGGNSSNTNPIDPVMTACGQNMTDCKGDYLLGMIKRQDDRLDPVPNTFLPPFNAVGWVGIHCIGQLIGFSHVLALGSCVHPGTEGGNYYTDIIDVTFMPRESLEEPVKPLKLRWKRVVAADDWLYRHDKSYNMALIVLRYDLTVSVTELVQSMVLTKGMEVDVVGFRLGKEYKRMLKTTGKVIAIEKEFFTLEVEDSMAMGSGVFLPGSNELCGIITKDWDRKKNQITNKVLMINEGKIRLIQHWMKHDSKVGVLNPKYRPHV